MGYPIPTVGGVSLSPHSKAYALIQKGTGAELGLDDVKDATEEQLTRWLDCLENPNLIRAESSVPELEQEIAARALETMQYMAIEIIGRLQENWRIAASEVEAEYYQVTLDIQVECSDLIWEALELIAQI